MDSKTLTAVQYTDYKIRDYQTEQIRLWSKLSFCEILLNIIEHTVYNRFQNEEQKEFPLVDTKSSIFLLAINLVDTKSIDYQIG